MKYCAQPGCPEKVDRGRCEACQRRYERSRGTATQRGYDHRYWRPLRDAHILEYPLCGGKRSDAYPSQASACRQDGRLTVATAVHHIVAHKGDRQRLLDPRNLESICEACHGRVSGEGDFGR